MEVILKSVQDTAIKPVTPADYLFENFFKDQAIWYFIPVQLLASDISNGVILPL